MIVIMQVGATTKQISAVIQRIEEMGLKAHISEGSERTIIGVVGDDRIVADRDSLSLLEGVGLTEDPSLSKLVPFLRNVTTLAGGAHSLGGGVERVRVVTSLR